jgi:hypothetical protein
MASPRPAPVISRRAGRMTPVATRGWMGGVSRREILSIKPETFFCAAFETSLKSPRSLACKSVQVYTTVKTCQVAHSSFSGCSSGFGVIFEPTGDILEVEHPSGHVHAEAFELSLRGLDLVAERGEQVGADRHARPLVAVHEGVAPDQGLAQGRGLAVRTREVLAPERRSPRPIYGCLKDSRSLIPSEPPYRSMSTVCAKSTRLRSGFGTRLPFRDVP